MSNLHHRNPDIQVRHCSGLFTAIANVSTLRETPPPGEEPSQGRRGRARLALQGRERRPRVLGSHPLGALSPRIRFRAGAPISAALLLLFRHRHLRVLRSFAIHHLDLALREIRTEVK